MGRPDGDCMRNRSAILGRIFSASGFLRGIWGSSAQPVPPSRPCFTLPGLFTCAWSASVFGFQVGSDDERVVDPFREFRGVTVVAFPGFRASSGLYFAYNLSAGFVLPPSCRVAFLGVRLVMCGFVWFDRGKGFGVRCALCYCFVNIYSCALCAPSALFPVRAF